MHKNNYHFQSKGKFLVFMILVLVFSTSGCLENRPDIYTLIIGISKPNNMYSFRNITRADITTIPVLIQAIDEVIAINSTNQQEFDIAQDEWDQIDQLFDNLIFPPQREGYNEWYISFEGTLLEIMLGHMVILREKIEISQS